MAVCNTQELLDVDPCLMALSPFTLKVVKLSLLCAIKTKLEGGAAVDCDIATLLEDGKCFYSLPSYVLDVLEVTLLCDLAALL